MKQQLGTLNYQWAFSLVHYYSLQGIKQAVISPGSRSTPLALACEKHPSISTHVIIDERSAGFYALGLAQSSQTPVLLICTSGTAVANWFPALIEANHSYTPLIFLSADRPDELQNCGANQTINQRFLFGSHVREFIQLEHPDHNLLEKPYLKKTVTHTLQKCSGTRPGPVHINIPLKEPLLPRRFTPDELNKTIDRLGQEILQQSPLFIQSVKQTKAIPKTALKTILAFMNKSRGLIVCGRLMPDEYKGLSGSLQNLSRILSCPVLIDPLSGLRLTQPKIPYWLVNYDTFLDGSLDKKQSKALEPDWIIHIGQFPLSKKLMNFLEVQKCPRLFISSYGDILDPLHKHKLTVNCLPVTFCQTLMPLLTPTDDNHWLRSWQTLEQKAQNRIERALDTPELYEGKVIDSLLRTIPEKAIIFSANSMAIRDFDTFTNQNHTGNSAIRLFANRGASGIDGNISTFAGLLTGTPEYYPVAVVGDLSFFHDMNGLLTIKKLQQQAYRGTIILINNHGGGIFNYLPPAQLDDYSRLWQTDTGLDFRHCAALYHLNYIRVTQSEALDSLLKDAFKQSGFNLIEFIIDPQTSVKCHKQI